MPKPARALHLFCSPCPACSYRYLLLALLEGVLHCRRIHLRPVLAPAFPSRVSPLCPPPCPPLVFLPPYPSSNPPQLLPCLSLSPPLSFPPLCSPRTFPPCSLSCPLSRPLSSLPPPPPCCPPCCPLCGIRCGLPCAAPERVLYYSHEPRGKLASVLRTGLFDSGEGQPDQLFACVCFILFT